MFTKAFILILLGVLEIKGDVGMKYIMKVYEDCQHSEVIPCLKRKAILFFDRAARMESIPVVDGIDIVKNELELPPISENDIDSNIPRGLGNKDQTLSAMLWDKIAAFANSRTVQFSLPEMSGEELNKGVEEGMLFSILISLSPLKLSHFQLQRTFLIILRSI